jgi:hypothetical protein
MKRLLTLLLVAVLLITVACSNAEYSPGNESEYVPEIAGEISAQITASAQTTITEPKATDTPSIATTEKAITTKTAEPVVAPPLNPSVMLWSDEIANRDFKAAIVDEVRVSRTTGVNCISKTSEINEFYFPAKINRFELVAVSFDEAGFSFSYTPSEKARSYAFYSRDTDIQVVIGRPQHMTSSHRNIYERFDAAVEGNNMTLIGDNIAYAGDGDIFGIIGDTIFRISAPIGMRDQETLVALALDLISTAELVNVDEEIGRLAQ